MSTTFSIFHSDDSHASQRSLAIWIALAAAVLTAASVLAPHAMVNKTEVHQTTQLQIAAAPDDDALSSIQSEPFGAALGVMQEVPVAAAALAPASEAAVDLQQVVLGEPFGIPQVAMK